MSDTFNFKRFWTYFKYDLKQMWRNHSKAAIMIGGSIAIVYFIWVLLSLVFNQQWTAPSLGARIATFFAAYTILTLYQTRTYGYLTDKRAGSSWLMLPASRTEKYVSMLLMTLVVIPILFIAVFFLLDGILSLLDPGYGQTLIGAFTSNWSDIVNSYANDSLLKNPIAPIVVLILTSIFTNFLYFLLCGICFKKNKIVAGIAISFGLSIVISTILGLVVRMLGGSSFNIDIDINNDLEGARIIAGILNGIEALGILIVIGLAWGIWRRLKTIQH